MPSLPSPRGPISEHLFRAWCEQPHEVEPLAGDERTGDPLADEDLHLSLYACYELHYRGFDEVDAGWEWEPSLLAARAELERRFEGALIDALGPGLDSVPPDRRHRLALSLPQAKR